MIELRYNYEWEGNYSIYLAPKFYLNKKKTITFQPLIGYTLGRYNGTSIDLQVSLDTNKLDIITDHQYTCEFNGQHWFFFDWIVARYKITEKFKVGLSTQIYYEPNSEILFDKGITASYLIQKHFRISVYYFNPFTEKYNLSIALRSYF